MPRSAAARTRNASRSMNRWWPIDNAGSAEAAVDVLELDAALEKLAALDPQQAKIVELRYFGGLTVEEAAEALDISPATVKRHWTIARAWLRKELAPDLSGRSAEGRSRMNAADRWQRVGALFDRALATPPPQRQTLVRSSPEPADIQDEVLELLKSHDDSRGFLEPPALLADGTTIGAYRIERILGRGGMGVVYLAHDTRLHRAVALKALPPHLFRDDRMRARLRQEARAAAALSHPSIATVYALEEIGDQIFIASEYLDGPTLREELKAGRLGESRALAIARTIAVALQAAHDRGIVHRDLKPENIIVTARRRREDPGFRARAI